MSEDDLRAYQQASNGMLQNAASAAGNWLSDNWEYIAAGAMVAAGVAVMCTGVGGPIGAAMMAGALTSAGGSIWSQKSANGTVDWGTVLRDGAVGAATGLIGGGASAAAARATAGMTSCLGKNILTGAVEGALGGGAGGALSHVTGIARYGCFTPDTPVLMADGSTKRIDQVQAGEQVLAHNPATGQDEPATVEQTFTHEKVPTLRVTTTSGTVETTATHPFHVQGRGYTPASDLHEGDILHTPDGHTTTVVSIQATGRTETVHNLAITGHHNYHVATTTGQPILVHNNQNPLTGENGACEVLGDAAESSEVPMYESRSAAFRSAKRDAGVPMSEQPSLVSNVDMTDKFDRHILDDNGLPISTREYHYTGQGHDPVMIQDHAAGHVFDDDGRVGQHFNVRDPQSPRHGNPDGTHKHYPWREDGS
ncbi:polymorphic toxin-type HINT domain-containing protein [Propionibacterium acidifaciens]|uniref:polymorphic toxin-type HINT domain-containing protein n=1 Tax=Propionibacterium acidifaciens TaxID=556499 RepID=UPI001866BC94|nr:polymorphic toxin-type HINT domain-containing protein [Propionibacterium acidifaciens]